MTDLVERMYATLGQTCITNPDVAHIEIHGNRVLGLNLVPGLEVDADETEEGVDARIVLHEGVVLENPVRVCFGVLPESGVQRITMRVSLEEGSRMTVLSSCTFPNALEVLHTMEADISVGRGAEYAYLERHLHGPEGGVEVVPHAKVRLEEGSRFRTDFELLRGRVGKIDIDYDAVCAAGSVLEMSARISGSGRDDIRIHERAILAGERSRGVLLTNIAVRDYASAEVKNTLKAEAAFARGHVDCKEIIRDHGRAKAVPVVEVLHPKAHVTHEAAIGSVDAKQLQTLMAHGLSEDQATDLIIEGLLSPSFGERD
jgi:hypothetical protein